MATYNGAKYIEEQLESLKRQTNRPLELIVADDGSTDDTLKIIRSFAGRASFPVRLTQNNPNKGYRRNFCDAAALAQGDIVAFCDQDDVWREDKLERLAEAFNDPSILLVHHNARLIDNHGQLIGQFRPAGALPALSSRLTYDPWFFPYGLCQAFRRQLVRWNDLRESTVDFYFDDQRLAHDQWYFILASVLGSIAYLDHELVDYRQHAANTYGLKKVQGLRERINVMVRVGGATFRKRYDCVQSLLPVLESICADCSTEPEALTAVRRAIAVFGRFSKRSRLRAQLYIETSRARRAGAWLGLLVDGAYWRRTPWCFGMRSMLRDGFFGVLIGPQKDKQSLAEMAV
jgi:glycosyltransferase involved in cell wall biosynthesis